MKIYTHDYPFYLESGHRLPTLQIVYHTFGQLSAAKDNVIWVCHALTANSDVADWWPHTVEAGRFLDPNRYFIVCANILGSCYGTTGPTSVCPETGEPWYGDFPKVTVRDMVHAHQLLARALGIEQVQLLIGASIGGFQALQWAVEEPQFAKRFAFIATGMRCTPWIAAFNESQRMTMELDPTLGERTAEAGRAGMAVARSIALLSYRGGAAYNLSQADTEEPPFLSAPANLSVPDNRSSMVRFPTCSRLVGISKDNTSDRTSLEAGGTTVSKVEPRPLTPSPQAGRGSSPADSNAMVRPGDRTSLTAGGTTASPVIAGEDACAPGQSAGETTVVPVGSTIVRPGDRNSLTAGGTPASPVGSMVRPGDRTSLTAGETPASPVIAGEDACAPGQSAGGTPAFPVIAPTGRGVPESSDRERVFRHRVQSYQRYQGEKLRKRFDAYSYLRMMDAVDSHYIPDGEPIHTPTLVVAISSDLLFTPEEHQTILDRFPNHEFHVIDSPFGHDGFLVEADLLNEIINKFIKDEGRPTPALPTKGGSRQN